MKWNRTTVKAVAIVFATIIATSFFIKWTFDHDGETVTIFGDDPTAASSSVDTTGGVESGGPFPFPGKDGSTFGNFEGLLPDHPRGYYAEYTVITPGSSDRGARRVIAGDGGEFYWTQDHYASFERIARRET